MILVLALASMGVPAATAPAQPEKKICRNADAEIGSMMPKRECKTKAEWAEIAKSNQQNADSYRRNRQQVGRVQSEGGL